VTTVLIRLRGKSLLKTKTIETVTCDVEDCGFSEEGTGLKNINEVTIRYMELQATVRHLCDAHMARFDEMFV